jgi:hypothetical protein
MARLDQALAGCPLTPAFLYRARLDAVRRQAAADGQLIDPWHLAAVLEGLRLRMEGALRIIDRCLILDAAQHALQQHQWLAAPDPAQEGEIERAEAAVAAQAGQAPLLAAARGFHAWIDRGGTRPPAGSGRVDPVLGEMQPSPGACSDHGWQGAVSRHPLGCWVLDPGIPERAGR